MCTECKEKSEDTKDLRSDLKTAYDLFVDRRKTLTSQAQNLMSFTAIIETILVGLLITAATDPAGLASLKTSPNYGMLLVFIGIGFVSYIITSLFSLFAFWEPKFTIVPQLGMQQSNQTVEIMALHYFLNPAKYKTKITTMQYAQAIDRLIRTNQRKYNLIKIATGFLVVGITSTMVGGLNILPVKVGVPGVESIAVWIPLGLGLAAGATYAFISGIRRSSD